MVANTECSLACFDSLNGKVDTTPAFCGEHKIGETPSRFLGCNEEFQKCMDKPLSFLEKWKRINRFWMTNYSPLYCPSVLTGAMAILVLGKMLAGTAGVVLAAPLAFAYIEFFMAT